jgi:hypothetical protein
MISDTRWSAKSRPFIPEELDPLIKPIVMLLRVNGIKTYTSCQGGKGHLFPEPTVRFHVSQNPPEGWRKVCKVKNILETHNYFGLHTSLTIDASWGFSLIGKVEWIPDKDGKPKLFEELVKNHIFSREEIDTLDIPMQGTSINTVVK